MLEVKTHAKAPHRPNQDYYINMFKSHGYADFIYPEVELDVIEDMVDYLGLTGGSWKPLTQFQDKRNGF